MADAETGRTWRLPPPGAGRATPPHRDPTTPPVDRHRARSPGGRGGARQTAFDELGTPLIETTFVVLDLETTGLSPSRDRVTEVGAVKVRGGEVLGELSTLVHPGRSIPPAVTALTGITDAMVATAPRIGAVLPALLEFVGPSVLVAHNAGFDLAFLRAALDTRDQRFDPVVIDTARLARRLLRSEVRDCRLATLARHLRARTAPDHRALTDARATVDVLHGLIERAGSLGATTVEDLRELARSSSEASYARIDLVRDAPRAPGVYRFLDASEQVLYVGRAVDLRARLRSYFGQDRRRRTADLVRATARVTWTVTPTTLEAEVREVREIHTHRPHYNRRSTRPEASVHVALTREPFPRLSVVREPRDGHAWTLGPLTSRRVAEELVAAVEDVLPLRTCTQRLRRAQDHPACVLKDLGRCGAPCDGTQSAASYTEVVAATQAALEDPAQLFAPLRIRMLELARDGRFEHARALRRRLHGAARALAGARQRSALASVDELVAVRPEGDSAELVVVRRGRLAGSARTDWPLDEAAAEQAVAALELLPLEGPPTRDDAEEVALVRSWLDGPGVRLVRAQGCWTEPVAGGAALAATLDEARELERQLRRDRQLIAGEKVRRRGPATD